MDSDKNKRVVRIAGVGTVLSCIACVILLFSCNNASKETEIPLRDIKVEIAAMEQWLNEAEQSKDPEVVPLVDSAVKRAGRLWQEFQELMISGQVSLKPGQGSDIEGERWNSPDDIVEISLTFRTEDRLLSEFKKRVYSPDMKAGQFYCLAFYKDLQTIKYCELDRNEFLWFYPSNKIRRYSRRLEPDDEESQVWYSIEWDRDGKIINELTQTFQKPEIELPDASEQ
jgi:hypothetical protein